MRKLLALFAAALGKLRGHGNRRAPVAPSLTGIAGQTMTGILTPLISVPILGQGASSASGSVTGTGTVGPPPTSAFTIQRTGVGYGDWFSATAAAQDGDIILVKPQTYAFTVQGFTGITKALTIQSAVAGQRYVLAISPDPSSGAIGAGFAIDCLTRFQRTGSHARFAVTIEDAEIYASRLTFVTGKCAIDVGINSGSCPLDLTIRNCYVHDYDQALEASNEYDPADRTSTITIENSIFAQCGCMASGDNNHTIYVGYTGSLSLKGCIIANRRVQAGDDETRYPGGWAAPTYDSGGNFTGPNYYPVGFLVKCRAKALTIDACRLTGQDSANSNCVEMGDGGDTLIRGSIFEQGSLSDGNAIVSYGRFYYDFNRNATFGEITSLDGRTNRLRIYQCTFLNSDTRADGQQFVEVSYHTTQTYWTAIGRTQAAPPLTVDIQNNLWVDNASVDAWTPETGVSPAPSGTGVTSAWGIACPGATNNTVKHFADLVSVTNRYAGWALATPIAGTAANAPFELVDVPLTDFALTSPTTAGRTDAEKGAFPPAPSAPAWYTSALSGGWTSLTAFPPIFQSYQVTTADRASPNDIGGGWKAVYPMYGDSAGYVTGGNNFPVAGVAKIAGVDPIPGYNDYRGDQGCSGVIEATVVRNGVTYSGNFVVWPAGGGHGVGINNQILAYWLEGAKFMDISQASMPPMGIGDATFNQAFSAWHGGPKGATAVGAGADGRPLSTHQYNTIVYDQKRNRVLWVDGPAQVVGPAPNIEYCVQLDGDAWIGTNDAVAFPARFKDYFDTSAGAFPNGRNAVQCVDNVADEIWNSFPNSGFANDVLVAHNLLVPGSTWQWVQVTEGNGPAQIAGASVVGWCMENEPWLVWINEVRPWAATILNRVYNNPLGRRTFWNVTFTPKDGNPANAIPQTGALTNGTHSNVDAGIPATVVFDSVDRLFYAIVFTLDGSPLMDVYKITPPTFDSSGVTGSGSTFVTGIGGTETVVQWVTEKLTKDPASVLQLPTLGNTTPGTGYYPSHRTASVVHTSWGKGIFFMHDPGQPPLFWKFA